MNRKASAQTVTAYRSDLKFFESFAKQRSVSRLAQIDHVFVREFIEHMQRQSNPRFGRMGLSDASIARRLAALKQVKTLLSASANQPVLRDLHDVATIVLGTGIRAGELAATRWSNIDFDQRVMTIDHAKSGKTEYAHLDDETLAVLHARREHNEGNDFVLGKSPRHVLHRASVQLRGVAYNLGIPASGFHSLRRMHLRGACTQV